MIHQVFGQLFGEALFSELGGPNCITCLREGQSSNFSAHILDFRIPIHALHVARFESMSHSKISSVQDRDLAYIAPFYHRKI